MKAIYLNLSCLFSMFLPAFLSRDYNTQKYKKKTSHKKVLHKKSFPWYFGYQGNFYITQTDALLRMMNRRSLLILRHASSAMGFNRARISLHLEGRSRNTATMT